MDTLVQELTNKYKYYSESMNKLSLLANQPWVVHSSSDVDQRQVYLFREEEKQLLVFENGVVKREYEDATWSYIDSMPALLMRYANETKLYHQVFFDPSILILRQDGEQAFQILINDNHLESNPDELLQQVLVKYQELEKQQQDNQQQVFSYLHPAPHYQELTRVTRRGASVGKYRCIKVRFADGEVGYLNRDRRGRYYLKLGSVWPIFLYYQNKQSCINGLYHYLNTGEVLGEHLKYQRQWHQLLRGRLPY